MADNAAGRLAGMAHQKSGPSERLADLADNVSETPGLPKGLRSAVERLSGVSLDGIRIHMGSSAPRQIGARAFARGSDVHVGPGETASIPHELWHVTQQRQGRVKPSGRLIDGTPLNNAPALEREATDMGARAMAERGLQPFVYCTCANVCLATSRTIAFYILKNGEECWIEDGEPIPPGATRKRPRSLSTAPEIIHAKGAGTTTMDEAGAVKRVYKKVPKSRRAPGHRKLKKQAETVGRELAMRSAARTDQQIYSDIIAIKLLILQLEAIAKDSVPKNHAKKVKKMYAKKGFTNTQYRTMTDGEDELLRSSTSAALFNSYRDTVDKPGTSPIPQHRALLHRLGRAFMQLASTMRTPTHGVVAPTTTVSGKVTGQQHPTEKTMAKLPGGSSAHGLNDPVRAQKALATYMLMAHDSSAPPLDMFMTMLLSAVVGTLNHMMFSLGAKNVENWQPAFQEQQRREREAVKAMGNVIARILGYKIITRVQHPEAASRAYPDASASPKRRSLPEFWEDIDNRKDILIKTLESIKKSGTSDTVTKGILAAVMTPDFDANSMSATLDAAYAKLSGWIAAHYATHQRGIVGGASSSSTSSGAHPAATAGGQRMPSFQQFFLECGQMATHNALAMAGHQADTNAALRGIGPMHNNINEGAIQGMLATQGHPEIPVVGNLNQMHALIGFLQDGEIGAIQAWHQTAHQQMGLATLNAFATGTTNELVAIVNTTGHLSEDEAGEHWIAVRLTRHSAGGPIHIQVRQTFNCSRSTMARNLSKIRSDHLGHRNS
ncbi:hypothetical protein GQR58_002368 [Nymphon striatum]|nr:hypothetical protein GQR58_002368 [Nymphon striatum]